MTAQSNKHAAPTLRLSLRPTWDELPAVVVPFFLNTALSAPSVSMVVLPRMPSSSLMVILVSAPVLGSTSLVATGTISSLNLPAARAAAAFLCERTANSS